MSDADVPWPARLRQLPVFPDSLPELDPRTVPDGPTELFVQWLDHAIAAGEPEPHAMTLSTVDADGLPDSRVLILKDVRDDRWWFASSAASAKGQQLAANPRAALCFHWKAVGRQVRLRGIVTEAPPAQAAQDFLSRSATGRAVALAGRQSSPLASLPEREECVARAREQIDAEDMVVAEDWRLYGLLPAHVEFWQADAWREHVRLAYDRDAGPWRQTLLWP